MAGTTINPYRFGGQLGYRRDGPNRLYIRERHLDTNRGRWLSRDPVPMAAADFNFYWYAKTSLRQSDVWARLMQQGSEAEHILGFNPYQYAYNNPIRYSDPSGLSPSSSAGTIIPCPAKVGAAKDALCKAIKATGSAGINNSGCCTGPKQSQCLVDWCNGPGNVYCVKDTTGWCADGRCATDDGGTLTGGAQDPEGNVYLCFPRIGTLAGCNYGTCKSNLESKILHEVMHNCGSSAPNGLFPDPAENKARCLCSKFGW